MRAAAGILAPPATDEVPVTRSAPAIRPLTPADADAYRAIRLRMLREHPDAFSDSAEERAREPEAVFHDRFAQRVAGPDRFILGAFDGDALVGTVGFYRHDGPKLAHKGGIWGMYVAPEARGRGVGLALLEAAVARVAAACPGVSWLQLGVATGNAPALRLYERAGFRTFGVEPAAMIVGGRVVDEALMARRVGGEAAADRAAAPSASPGALGLALAALLAGTALLAAPGAGRRTGAAQSPRSVDVLEIGADADTTLDRARPDVALGTSPAITIGRELAPDGTAMQALVRFPLGDLPPDARLVTATLRLRLVAARGSAEVRAWLAPVDAPWDEASATWGNPPPALAARHSVLVGPEAGDHAFDVTALVSERLERAGPGGALGLLVDVAAGALDAGRLRAFAGREASGAAPPRLDVAYVGPGTPHPLPSATGTPSPSATPTVSGTPPPTPSPTTTSTFGQLQGRAVALRPSDGAALAQPLDGEVWVFEWAFENRGPCGHTGSRLVLSPEQGAPLEREIRPFAFAEIVALERPVAAGRWTWTVDVRCTNGPTIPSEPRAFLVAPFVPTVTPTATPRTPTPTATRLPIWTVSLPFAGRPGP